MKDFNSGKFENLSMRYARQIAIPHIGIVGQKKLLEAKVLVIGCGALGSMAAMQLAGAGIGNIGIADFDNIEISNLQRQFFFFTSESGQSKAVILQKKILAFNPDIHVEIYNQLITPKIAVNIFPNYDFIVDATDNPNSKKMIDSQSQILGIPCCIGGVRDFSGQIITLLPGGRRFDEFFEDAGCGGFLPCSVAGVAGPAAALCASIQTSEVIKYFTKAGVLLSGRLLTFDLLTNTFKIFFL